MLTTRLSNDAHLQRAAAETKGLDRKPCSHLAAAVSVGIAACSLRGRLRFSVPLGAPRAGDMLALKASARPPRRRAQIVNRFRTVRLQGAWALQLASLRFSAPLGASRAGDMLAFEQCSLIRLR